MGIELEVRAGQAALLDLAEMLEVCVATPGSSLWFIGD